MFSRGFQGRRERDADLPPGQYLTDDFPVLSAGPTPPVTVDDWSFTVTMEAGERTSWSWAGLMALPA